MDEAEAHIRRGDVFERLSEQFGGEIDLSIYDKDHYKAKRDAISKGRLDLLQAYESRKWWVKNNGICLLLALTNELIQQRGIQARDH